jgi:hypothetical protein
VTGKTLFIACTAALLVLTSQVQGQQNEGPNWYTVELIVFRYLEPDSEEIFPLLPELKYPDSMRLLEAGESQLDPQHTLELLGPEQRIPSRAFSLDRTAPDIAAELPIEIPEPDYRVPAAYVLLDAAEREFNSEGARIRRSKGMRLLFHQAWRQPVHNRDQASDIQIDSEGMTDFPVLQGSIKLYVSRYLHLETNLWLNDSRTDLPEKWAMPAPPLPTEPGPEIIDYQFRIALPEQSYFDVPSIQLDDLASVSPEPFDEEEFLSQRFYVPFNHALLLQQKRRMRSGELHYIDHPRLGVMIKLVPYEFSPILPPETELMSR